MEKFVYFCGVVGFIFLTLFGGYLSSSDNDLMIRYIAITFVVIVVILVLIGIGRYVNGSRTKMRF